MLPVRARHELTRKFNADFGVRYFFRAGGRSGADALEHFGREANGFAERRMRVDRLADIDGVGAHFDRERDFADQIAGVRADDAAADDPVRCVVEQELR